ncbi:MAG: TIGR04211 family SH3 domain-containing protein [Proteobacteria bacterium]|nr:TIGR04211 family SH3 domain-containing protein [Pseudomonadota bacterium]
MHRLRSAARFAPLLSLLVVFGAGVAHAQAAWVRGEVRLNLRTGPGQDYRILGVIKTGDEVRVLQRGENWTKIRSSADGKEGWIPGGYLQQEPPPAIRVTRLEAEVQDLRAQLQETTDAATVLREQNETIGARDAEQRQEIESLTMDNAELRAGSRWPELIAGASILAMGMVLGSWLRSSRRQSSRIRL